MKLNKKGFTIVELVIVIAVIAILAAVLIPTFANVIKKANQSADAQNLRNMNTAIAIDKTVNENFGLADAVKAAYNAGYNLQVKDEDHIYVYNKVKGEFEYVEKTATLGADYETMTIASDPSEFETAIDEGGVIYLKGTFNFTNTDKVLNIKKDTVIIGDKTNLTMPSNGLDSTGVAYWPGQKNPLFNVTEDNVALTICSCNLQGTSDTNSLVCVAANGVTLNIFDSTLTSSKYAVNIRNYNNLNSAYYSGTEHGSGSNAEDAVCNVTIKDTTINAELFAINWKYVKGELNIESSALSTVTHDTICCGMNGGKMNISNTTFSHGNDSEAGYISVQESANNTMITFDKCSFAQGNASSQFAIATSSAPAGTGNKIIVDGTVVAEGN